MPWKGRRERDALAVRCQGVAADAAVDARDATGSPPSFADRIEIAVAREVVRLAAAVGHEVDLRAVGRPRVARRRTHPK